MNIKTFISNLIEPSALHVTSDALRSHQKLLLLLILVIFTLSAFLLSPFFLYVFSEPHAVIMGKMLLVFSFVNFLSLLLILKSTTLFREAFYLMLANVNFMMTVALIYNTEFSSRLIWYVVPIFLAAFIGGRKVAQILIAISFMIISIYLSLYYDESGLSLHDVLESFIMIVTILFLVAFYEHKNSKDTKEIHYLNNHLEAEVAHQVSEIEETQREIVYQLGELSETRSKETGYHVQRVAHFSKYLAELYGLSAKDTELIFYASPMHDIGKIGIPDAILLKPSRLNKAEMEVMKTHSAIGHKLFANSTRPLLKATAVITISHHEKYDGSGYPNAIVGDDIPIFGRITAIADVFDALASERSYKKAWSNEEIITYFKEQSGKHFDPTLCTLLLDNYDEFLAIKKRIETPT